MRPSVSNSLLVCPFLKLCQTSVVEAFHQRNGKEELISVFCSLGRSTPFLTPSSPQTTEAHIWSDIIRKTVLQTKVIL